MVRDSDVNQEKWWEIWVAGVAVYTKCISNGLKGTAVNLGKLCRCSWDALSIPHIINDFLAHWLCRRFERDLYQAWPLGW